MTIPVASKILLQRAIVKMVAAAGEKKVAERQKFPLSVQEWRRLEEKRRVLAEVSETGVLP